MSKREIQSKLRTENAGNDRNSDFSKCHARHQAPQNRAGCESDGRALFEEPCARPACRFGCESGARWGGHSDFMMEVTADGDIYIVCDGARIAKRSAFGAWIAIEPSFEVIDSPPDGVLVRRHDARAH